MAVIRKISRTDAREIRDHRDNTAKDLIKCYTLSQLSIMDWIDTRTIKTSGRYLPVRIDHTQAIAQFKAWRTKKPYSIMWIRLDEIKFLFNKRTHKKLTVE